MSEWLRPGERAWLAMAPRVDLTRRPTTVELRVPRIAGIFGAVFGAIWLTPSLGLATSVGGAPWPVIAFAWLFPAIGLALILGSLLSLTRARRVTFEQDGVAVVDRGPLGSSSWRLAYRDFAGVMLRERTIRRKNSSTTYHIVELHHPDRTRCLPLYVSRNGSPPRAAWEAAAKALDLPALLPDAAGPIVRAAGDLDRSLKELAASGQIQVDERYRETPPAGLLVSKETEPEETIRVAIRRRRLPLWLLLPFGGMPLAVMIAGLSQPEAWPMALFGLGFLGIAGLMWFLDGQKARELRITRRAIALDDPWPWDRRARKRLALDEIETVRIRRSPSNLGPELVIEGDRGYIALGPGINAAGNAWLRSLIVAAIARA